MSKHFLHLLSLLFSINGYSQTFSEELINPVELISSQYGIEYNAGTSILAITEVDVTNDFRNKVKLYINDTDGTNTATYTCETLDADFSISGNELIALPNGNLLISGIYSANNQAPYFPALFAVSASGSIIWAKKIDVSIGNPPLLTLLSDNSVLVSLVYNNGTMHRMLFKMDSSGNASNFYEIPISLVPLQISARNAAFEILFTDGNLVNIQNDLSAINWQLKYFDVIGITHNYASNGNHLWASAQVAFPGHMTVFRTTQAGQVLWVKYLETFNAMGQEFDIVGFHFIQEDTQGNIVVSANSEGGLNGSLQIVLDANGNYLANYKIETFKNRIKLLDADTYLIAGFLGSDDFNTSNIVLENRLIATPFECDSEYTSTITDGDEMAMTPDNFSLTPIVNLSFTDEALVSSIGTTASQNYCNLTPMSAPAINEATLSVHPNPSASMVTIESDQEINALELLASDGKSVLKQARLNTHKMSIDVSSLHAGVYILRIETIEQIANRKLIIKNE